MQNETTNELLTTLMNHVVEMKADVAEVKADVRVLKTDVATLMSSQSSLASRFVELDKRAASRSDVEKIKIQMAEETGQRKTIFAVVGFCAAIVGSLVTFFCKTLFAG